jgi:hypothetical protein
MINRMRDHYQKRFDVYLERRNRLWIQIKTAHPVYTEAEIDARLEQLGAWVQTASRNSLDT